MGSCSSNPDYNNNLQTYSSRACGNLDCGKYKHGVEQLKKMAQRDIHMEHLIHVPGFRRLASLYRHWIVGKIQQAIHCT